MLDELHPQLAAAANELLRVAYENGLNPQVTSTVRTWGQQAVLWRRFMAGLSTYPAAPPGRSAHQWGWAFDVEVTPHEALWRLGALWRSWGGGWGGAHDPIHFELPGASQWLRDATDQEISSLGN